MKSLSRRRIANPELSPAPCFAAELLHNLQQTHVMSFRKLLITDENVIYYLAIKPLITAPEKSHQPLPVCFPTDNWE